MSSNIVLRNLVHSCQPLASNGELEPQVAAREFESGSTDVNKTTSSADHGVTVGLSDVHGVLGGAWRVRGCEEPQLVGLAALDAQDARGRISFCSMVGIEARDKIECSTASLLLVDRKLPQEFLPKSSARWILAVDNPRLAFIHAANEFFPGTPVHKASVAPNATIHATASIAANAEIGAGVVVEAGCSIGEGCTIGPHVILHARTSLARNVVVQSGAVLGSDGYGFERDSKGRLHRFPHVGRVIVDENVEIGARACIDRGGLSDTMIGVGSKIDDGAYIAHNVRVGDHCLIMAHAVLCGSSRIGNCVEISPGAVIRDKVTIGDHARIGLGAVVVSNVPAGECVAGHPARKFVVRT